MSSILASGSIGAPGGLPHIMAAALQKKEIAIVLRIVFNLPGETVICGP